MREIINQETVISEQTYFYCIKTPFHFSNALSSAFPCRECPVTQYQLFALPDHNALTPLRGKCVGMHVSSKGEAKSSSNLAGTIWSTVPTFQWQQSPQFTRIQIPVSFMPEQCAFNFNVRVIHLGPCEKWTF